MLPLLPLMLLLLMRRGDPQTSQTPQHIHTCVYNNNVSSTIIAIVYFAFIFARRIGIRTQRSDGVINPHVCLCVCVHKIMVRNLRESETIEQQIHCANKTHTLSEPHSQQILNSMYNTLVYTIEFIGWLAWLAD